MNSNTAHNMIDTHVAAMAVAATVLGSLSREQCQWSRILSRESFKNSPYPNVR